LAAGRANRNFDRRATLGGPFSWSVDRPPDFGLASELMNWLLIRSLPPHPLLPISPRDEVAHVKLFTSRTGDLS
jgi:hypothetical protein